MFETPKAKRSGLIWKILPLSGIAVLLVMAVFYKLQQVPTQSQKEITGVLHKGDSDFDWYDQYIILKDPHIQMARNAAGKRMVIFSGRVDNIGEKTLDVVEVKLLFFNYNTLVWSTTRTPIRPGPYTPPVPSLTSRVFTLYVEDIPTKWDANNAEMSISGFRFKR